jgi:hypothetical protein
MFFGGLKNNTSLGPSVAPEAIVNADYYQSTQTLRAGRVLSDG